MCSSQGEKQNQGHGLDTLHDSSRTLRPAAKIEDLLVNGGDFLKEELDQIRFLLFQIFQNMLVPLAAEFLEEFKTSFAVTI